MWRLVWCRAGSAAADAPGGPGLLGVASRTLGRSLSSLPEPAEAAQSLPQLPPFAHKPAVYRGLPKEEVLDLRKRYLSPSEGREALAT
jgi:hypothetical protein